MPAMPVIASFAALSLIAVLSGAATAWSYGVTPALLALNGAAWGVGLGAALTLKRATPAAAPWTAVGAAVLLLLTLASAGMSGVHRWIALGPVQFNAAELVLPLVLTVLTTLPRSSLLRLLLPVIIALILAAQPDASQAAAFAAGAAIIVAVSEHSVAVRATTVLGLVTAALITAFRPDSLAPVPEVEGIIALAAHRSVVLATLAVLSLAGIVLLFAKQAQRPAGRWAALALTLYFAITAAAPLFGAYPVPLVGIGISPILGLWLGVGRMLRARDLE